MADRDLGVSTPLSQAAAPTAPPAVPLEVEPEPALALPSPPPTGARARRLRFRSSGDEAGTPLADRPFRPDVEGLRALAVSFVVLYHAGFPSVTGGFIGVDVFFVVSGFVITGLLLRERAVERSTDLISFYARRCRRILPAATLVLVVSVLCSYHFLGFVSAAVVAADARAAALFSANFHFIAEGTNYISARQPPSPIQNFWSLAVEEQFYLVYPTIFLLVVGIIGRKLTATLKLVVVLSAIIGLSYAWSIIETANNATAAYFSPFTRAWELALGALVAVLTPSLQRLPTLLAAATSWVGLSAICVSAFAFGAGTAYPGALSALPVVGCALVIAGGARVPAFGAEWLLGRRPFQWLAKLSYSLYLWHWPMLTIAAEASPTPLSLGERMLLVLAALGLSVASYFVVENPIRHSRWLARHKWMSVGLGALLVGITLLVVTFELHTHP